MHGASSTRRALVLAVLLGTLPLEPALAEEVIGRVVSIDGDVFAAAPGEDPRRLRCGDPIYRGDSVTTTFGGRLGVLVDRVRARLGDGSRVGFDLTAEGAPAFFLATGRLQLVDARTGDPSPIRIATPRFEATAVGSDTDVWVADETPFATTTLCEASSDVRVRARDGGSLVASTGQCLELGGEDAFAKQPRELAPLGATGEPCDDLLGPMALHPVGSGLAAPPLPLRSPDPRPFPEPPRGPCDEPGSGCVNVPTATPPATPPVPPVVEQPVVPCQIPGLCTP